MVPAYQLSVDLLIAAGLALLAAWWPLFGKERLPRWAELGLVGIALVLVGGVTFALTFGHWPFRG
jgi:hypothetical protein